MLKITFILVFSLGLLSDVTSESKSCKVPNIKNGEFGRYTSSVNFEKVGELEIIKDEEIVTLRCLKGYAPDPRQNNNPINGFFEDEVTCGDGVWSKNVSCRSNSCYIPDVKNGEMGHFETRYSTNNYAGFKKFSIGQRVNQSETVYLRCEDGYFPAEGSSIYYSNQLEIRCHDRTWSKDVQCKAAPCLGKPPKIDNGEPVTNSREHGYVMRYTCNDNVTTMIGNVTCHFGSWIGNTPICPDSRCYKKDLYPYKGLKQPEKEFFLHLESFKVECEKEYNSSTPEGDVTCLNGTWIMPENSCKESEKQDLRIQPGENSAAIPQNVTAVSANQHTSDTQHASECSCNFDYYNYLVVARARNKILAKGDNVRWGETVSFECRYNNNVIAWHNGLSLSREVNITCSTCQKWQTKDLPTCMVHRDGTPTIILDKKAKLLPHGVAEIQKGERIELTCLSIWSQPTWQTTSKNASVHHSSFDRSGEITHIAFLYITEQGNEESIRNQCIMQDASDTTIASNVLELRISDDPYRCSTNLLNYTGLKKPSEEFFSHLESFNISCKNGFVKSTVKGIKCVAGEWDLKENPCREGEKHDLRIQPVGTSAAIPQHLTAVSANHHTSDIQHVSECSCNFDYYNYLVVAWARNKILARGDNVRQGETVSFECRYYNNVIGWQNGLRLSREVNITCSTCQKWQTKELPTCMVHRNGDPTIILDKKAKLLPHGVAEIQKGERIELICLSIWSQPRWQTTSKNSSVHLSSVNRNGKITYITFLYITEQGNEERVRNQCIIPDVYGTIIASNFLELQLRGIVCPMSFTDASSVSFSNGNQVNSVVTFTCPSYAKLVGAVSATCQNDSTWSSPQPSCKDYVLCVRFPDEPGLKVVYSKGVSVGSTASFTCAPPNVLIGNTYTICQDTGIWNYPPPSCKAPNCSIHNLSISVPEGVVPDMTLVTGEFMPLGSKIQLECENNLIINGNSKAVCGSFGKWQLGSFQCVPGCLLKVDSSSHLVIKPLKDSYRLGEFVLVSCPPGEEMSNDVERLMCLGKIWSHPIPDCKASK